MTRLNRRRLTDVALVASLTGAWVTHEAGMVLHSIISLFFAAALAGHIKNNWAVYRSMLRRRTLPGAVDGSIATLMVIVVATGLVFWATAGDYTLGHEPLAIVATVALLAHFWSHRRSLKRLVRSNHTQVAAPNAVATPDRRS